MAEKDVNDEIYKILGRGKPSEEDVAKNPKLKEDWDKAQQLIKDNWKDGVPDKFMAKAFPKYDTKVTLGYYDAKQAKKLANIVAGLKEFDENNPDDKMLDKFINADNTPNGNTPATYIANHAIAMQKMLDNGEHKNDEDIAKMQSFLQAQQETLQMLADNGADFSKTDKNNQNVEDVAKIGQPEGKYSAAIDEKFIAKTRADGEKHQDSVVVEEKLKALNVKEKDAKGQTNIGNTQTLAPNEQRPQQPQEELEGDVKPEDRENGGGSEAYKGPAIKEKDIIDYLYNDVFIYYLNMLADKIIGYIKGKADKFAEYTRTRSAEAQKSKSNLRSQQCNTARQKCVGLFQNTAPQLTADMERAQVERTQSLRMLNSELRDNIVQRRPIEQWAFPSMQQRQQQMQQQMQQMQQMGADASDEQRQAAQERYAAETSAYQNITETFKQLYTQDPENCMKQLEMAEKNLDKYLELRAAAYQIALQRVIINKVDKALEESSPSFVNKKEWDFNDKETIAKLDKDVQNETNKIMYGEMFEILKMSTDHSRALGYDETKQAEMAEKYLKTYVDITLKDTKKAFDLLMDDVSHDRFKSNSKEINEKAESMNKEEAKAYKAKFVRVSKEEIKEMNDTKKSFDKFRKEMKVTTDDGKEMTLPEMVENVQKIDFSQRLIIDELKATQDIIAAAQGQLHDRHSFVIQGKNKLFGTPDNPKSKIERKFTPKGLIGGGRNG